MATTRVWILYKPTIYADLFQFLFESIDAVEVIRSVNIDIENRCLENSGVDIILLPLDEDGRPSCEEIEQRYPDAKVLAFAPDGERGLRRKPGKKTWDLLCPFGLSDLMFEVMQTS